MLLVVTGLKAEARAAAPLARRPGSRIVAAGGDPARVRTAIERAFLDGADAVLSFGLAAGLAPELHPGSLLVPDDVVDATGRLRFAVDPAWTARLRARLPAADRRPLCGVSCVLAGVDDKAAVFSRSGAIAADMESLAVAQACAAAGRRFALVRVVCDPASRPLPPAARRAMRADGRIDVAAVIGSLAGRPGQVPALLRVAVDARTAMAALRAAALLAGGADLDRA